MFGVNQVRWLAQIKQLSANAVVLNCVWMLGGGAGRTVVAFGSNLVLMWFLLPEEFGRFALVQATIGLVAGTAHLKIKDIIIRESSQELEAGGKDILFSALVVESIVLGLGAWCLLWLAGLWKYLGPVFFCSAPWRRIGMRWSLAYYERSFHYKNLAMLESGAHFLGHVFVAIGAALGIGYPVLYLQRLPEVIGRFSGLLCIGGMVKFRLRWLRPHDWKILYQNFEGFGWMGGWNIFLNDWSIVMVGWLAGEKAVGYFFQARKLAGTPQNLIAPATERVAYNYFSHRVASERGTPGLGQVLAVQSCVLGVVGVAVFFLANPLIPMVFGLQWEPCGSITPGNDGSHFGEQSVWHVESVLYGENRMRFFVLLGRGHFSM